MVLPSSVLALLLGAPRACREEYSDRPLVSGNAAVLISRTVQTQHAAKQMAKQARMTRGVINAAAAAPKRVRAFAVCCCCSPLADREGDVLLFTTAFPSSPFPL